MYSEHAHMLGKVNLITRTEDQVGAIKKYIALALIISIFQHQIFSFLTLSQIRKCRFSFYYKIQKVNSCAVIHNFLFSSHLTQFKL